MSIPEPISAADAFTRLIEGNRRFASGTPMAPPLTPDHRMGLLDGQRPFATVLGCVDSRAPLEGVFDVRVGELLTVRSAGQALAGATLGSVEFGPRALGTELVAVVGHTFCGAVGAALADERPEGPLGDLIGEITGRLPTDHPDYDQAVAANVAAAVGQLRALPTMVLPDGRRPTVVGLVDDLATGRVRIIDAGGLDIPG